MNCFESIQIGLIFWNVASDGTNKPDEQIRHRDALVGSIVRRSKICNTLASISHRDFWLIVYQIIQQKFTFIDILKRLLVGNEGWIHCNDTDSYKRMRKSYKSLLLLLLRLMFKAIGCSKSVINERLNRFIFCLKCHENKHIFSTQNSNPTESISCSTISTKFRAVATPASNNFVRKNRPRRKKTCTRSAC